MDSKERQLKMEITTLILGYENELQKYEKKEISEWSKGCLERYFELVKELKEE